jgi:hypothetical protein
MQDHAFISRNTVGDHSILSFYINTAYELPTHILSCGVEKFQEVLTYASKLIELEESLKFNFGSNPFLNNQNSLKNFTDVSFKNPFVKINENEGKLYKNCQTRRGKRFS